MNEFLVQILRSSLFQQLFPFFVLFIVPFTVIFLVKSAPSSKFLLYSFVMVLESLGLVLPWNWGHSSGSTTGVTHHEKRRNRKKASKASEGVELSIHGHGDGYYPGLVNISGTYCFMNSTVQALSSLSYLQPHLDTIHEKAELFDVPTPVIDTLRDLLHRLNTSHSRPSSIRPIDLITVLSSRSGLNSLINSREHQDAQELFQLLSECIKSEITAIDKEQARDRGLGGLAQATEHNREIGKSVFDGLTAHRRSCVVCGYTEAVMHFPFDNWQLAVPRMASTCLLEDCLSDYTRLEVLKDCICRKCSLNATHRRLIGEVETLSQAQNPTPSKKKRLKEVKKMEVKVRAALEQGRIEDELEGVRMEKVFSAMSTKQAMIARPPPVLVLHINRSMHFTHYASKNNIRILFPEVLDLTPFTTSGNLSIVPTSSMSTPSPPPQRSPSFSPSPSVSAAPTRSRSGTPTLESQKDALSRTIYRLSAVVCHYGAHSFGHYVCFRRKPKSGVAESERWKSPKLVIETALPDPSAVGGPDGNEESAEGFEDYVWEDSDPETAPGSGRGWLRVSDDSVAECGIESVLQEGSGAFMLYYERAIISTPPSSMATSSMPMNGSARHESPYPISNGLKGGYQGIGVGVGTPLDSEETLRPETMTTVSSIHLNGSASVGSLISSVESGKEKVPLSSSVGAASWSGGSFGGSTSGSPVMGARIVRSVATGRVKRSLSATPSLNESISLSTSPTSSALSSSLPISSTQPIPMPNGYSRTTNGDLDSFENVNHGDAAVDSSPKSPLGMHIAPQTDLLSTKLKTLSNTSLSSMASSTSSISPPSSTVSSNASNPKSPVRKRKKTSNSHSPSHKQAPIVV